MNHQGTKQLESDRLLLRRFRIEDAGAMFANWAGDPQVTQYLTWPRHENAEDSEKILADWINRYAEDVFYQWAIVLKEDGAEPIGGIGAVKENMNEATAKVEVGYCIGKKWWRQGITSEALSLVIRYFFDEVGANRVEACHDPRNVNSGRVMLKCGMLYEGTLRQADRNNQGLCDLSIYAVLMSDFRAVH